MDLDLQGLRRKLFQTASDPSLWSDALADLSRQAQGAGAILFCTDRRFLEAPCSPDLEQMRDEYRRGAWAMRDERYKSVGTLLEHGIASEFDFTTPETMRRSDYYQDFLGRHGRQWFAGIGFHAGADFWCLSIQRTVEQGPYSRPDLTRLRALWQPFADAATLSRLTAQSRLSSLVWGLDAVTHAAIVCDAAGRINAVNETARALLGPLLAASGAPLRFCDPMSRDRYDRLIKEALAPDPARSDAAPLQTTILAADRTPLLVRAIHVPERTGEMFSGAAILLLVKKVSPSLPETLSRRFHLTSAEIEVCKALADGLSVTDISAARGVRPDTTRTQLKRIFAKTGTQRQSELVLLVTKLVGDDETKPRGA